MALFNSGRILSGTAANATLLGQAGKYAAGDKVTPCTVQGERVRFIFSDGVDAGEPVGLQMPGSGTRIPVLAGEALDEMDTVIVNADGKFINADAAVAGDFIVGQVIMGSSADAEGDDVVIDFWENPQQVEPAP
jgi:hypothetical protein